MAANPYIGVFRQCENPDCRFRYADMHAEYETAYCPKCGGLAEIQSHIPGELNSNGRQKFSHRLRAVLLDNIRSAYNVGSIFRTSDGLGIPKVFLSGITPTPEHPRLNKTALGAQESLDWCYRNNALDIIKSLRVEGFQIIGLENVEGAIPLHEFSIPASVAPVCLIVGNERLGVDPCLLSLCDKTICIPMHGEKESLNVSIAFAIAAYSLVRIMKSV